VSPGVAAGEATVWSCCFFEVFSQFSPLNSEL